MLLKCMLSFYALCLTSRKYYSSLFVTNETNAPLIQIWHQLMWLPHLPQPRQSFWTKGITASTRTRCIDRTHWWTTASPHSVKSDLIALFSEFKDTLALPGEPSGKNDIVEHSIPLKADASPCYVPVYSKSHPRCQVADQLVADILDQNIIAHSSSPWNFPLFVVPKSDGKFRPVMNYRKLNELTVQNRHPIPAL